LKKYRSHDGIRLNNLEELLDDNNFSTQYCRTVFKYIDINQDGGIDAEEFIYRMFYCFYTPII
jgi:Ca2+-binding EF-hand superfamily protein